MKSNNRLESRITNPYTRMALDVVSDVSENLVNLVSNLYKSGTTDLYKPIGKDINIILDRLPTIGRYAGPNIDRFLNNVVENLVKMLAIRGFSNSREMDSAGIWYLFIIHDTVEEVKKKGRRIDLDNITMGADAKADYWNEKYKQFLKDREALKSTYG